MLNSLAEEKLQASVRVLAQHGRFLEIGKFDLSNNTSLGKFVAKITSLFRYIYLQTNNVVAQDVLAEKFYTGMIMQCS